MRQLERRHSLRGRLLRYLLGAVVAAALTQALVAYFVAWDEAGEIFDYQLQQLAMAVGSGLPMAAVPGAVAGPEGDGLDFMVQVWSADGASLFRSASARLGPAPDRGFIDMREGGVDYRVFSTRSGARLVQVSQDLEARRKLAETLALRTVAPLALLAPLLLLLIWWIVTTSLKPVARVRVQVSQRQADDLGEVSERDLPDEIVPLVRELNLLFSRLAAVFDAQQTFVADAAHELRTPLAALKLQVRGLRRATETTERELAIERLDSGVDRAARLVEQLLVLARQQVVHGQQDQVETVELAELVRQCVADAAPDAYAKGIDLGMPQAQQGGVAGEPGALRILAGNLVDNALKYSPRDGCVDVRVESAAHGMRLVVDDSGPGIARTQHARVFDRFYRIAGATAPGSGLGLSIVKAIAERHGAQLELEVSERLGGLRVVVTFPRLGEVSGGPRQWAKNIKRDVANST